MSNISTVGKVKKIQAATKWSQVLLGQKIGVTGNTVNRWLNGKNKPTMEVVINRINEVYNREVGE